MSTPGKTERLDSQAQGFPDPRSVTLSHAGKWLTGHVTSAQPSTGSPRAKVPLEAHGFDQVGPGVKVKMEKSQYICIYVNMQICKYT